MTDPSAPTIAVRGESTREVDPEIAEFTVTVSARDKDRATTLRRLADRVATLRTILDGYAAAIEKSETYRMSVFAEMKRAGEKITAYVGNATTSVTVTDLDILGEMMLRVVDNDQTSVNGPVWAVRPGSPVYREARHAAIADAITRAKEYAEALGARVIGLVELTDAGISGSTMTPMGGRFSKSRGGYDGGKPDLDLNPQRQRIDAQVQGRFWISEPTVLADPLD